MSFTHDAIIVGRGLAGVVLSETLRAQGLRVLVFDVAKPNSASAVAAGVVNPVAMRRIIASWRAGEMLPIAETFYRKLEGLYACKLWHPLPLVRLFANAREADGWQVKLTEREVGPFLAAGDQPGFQQERFHAEHGYGRIPGCAWLDVPALLHAHRSHWSGNDMLIEREVSTSDVIVHDHEIEVHGHRGRWLIWCNGPFAQLPGLVPTRGDLMTFSYPDLQCETMVHRSGFLLPVGGDRYRVGSTFAWDHVWRGTSESGRAELMNKLNALLKHSPPGPFAIETGVRPATRDRRPLLGQVTPRQATLNGLGSRGVLLAPWCAEHLSAHLFHGTPLDPEVDLSRSR